MASSGLRQANDDDVAALMPSNVSVDGGINYQIFIKSVTRSFKVCFTEKGRRINTVVACHDCQIYMSL